MSEQLADSNKNKRKRENVEFKNICETTNYRILTQLALDSEITFHRFPSEAMRMPKSSTEVNIGHYEMFIKMLLI